MILLQKCTLASVVVFLITLQQSLGDRGDWDNDISNPSDCSTCRHDRAQVTALITGDTVEGLPGVNKDLDESLEPKSDQLTASHLIHVTGGRFIMGTNDHVGYASDHEGPRRVVSVDSFYMEETEVTNQQFAEFVASTGHVTDSERFNWSFTFHTQVPQSINEQITEAVAGAEWWLPVPGANWKFPFGKLYTKGSQKPHNDVFSVGKESHPAVHLSWYDAKAYCEWKYAQKDAYTNTTLEPEDAENGNLYGRLPTEAEWEYAARGPSGRIPDDVEDIDIQDLEMKYYDLKYPWGNKLMTRGSPGHISAQTQDSGPESSDEKLRYRANFFQGKFPTTNLGFDGHVDVAPVYSYGPQNDHGFHNLIGNAWEWVDDWWVPSAVGSPWHTNGVTHNPRGPETGTDKVKKGGSYLCHSSYCNRYRTAARTQSTPDSASCHTGVRCVVSRRKK